MDTHANLPIYFKCFFFDKKNKKVVSTFKIEAAQNEIFPFQLAKLVTQTLPGWRNLSVYASVHDAVGIVLEELLSAELSDEIYHGKSLIDPSAIVDKIAKGDRLVAIYDEINNEAFRIEYDIAFEDLIRRKRPRLNGIKKKTAESL